MLLNKLKLILKDIDSAVIAFSGGVDSTFLAKVALGVLKDKVVAVTVVSALIPEAEKKEAVRLARSIGVPHYLITQRVGRTLRDNHPDRCYHCKKEIYSKLLGFARQKRFAFVIDGSNQDDLGDYRPGTRALRELHIRSPLQEAGFTKQDIRLLSRKMGLDTWNKPAMACLASRFPYGETFTEKTLKMVERAENFLREQGIAQVRVRHHGNLCRIETEREDMARLLKNRQEITRQLKSFGYVYVALDLEGYRTGSMNETIKWKKKK